MVEHDKDMILEADYVLDIGPRAGKHGGEILWQGKPKDLIKANTITADYLTGKRSIEIPKERRKGNGKFLKLKGATGNNLKNVNLEVPLGKLVVVTGISGSGKSSLINGTLIQFSTNIFTERFKNLCLIKNLKVSKISTKL